MSPADDNKPEEIMSDLDEAPKSKKKKKAKKSSRESRSNKRQRVVREVNWMSHDFMMYTGPPPPLDVSP